MPGREKQFAPAANSLEHWLRRIFVEDWSLKLLALAITLVLWFFISGRVAEREVAVEPRLEGKPAANFEVKEAIATPAKIKVEGPIDRVSAIEKVQTQPISIEGRRESFDVPRAVLSLSDSKIEPVGTVSVHVTIVATGNSKPKSRDTN
jgi:hypothetical protein